MANDLVVERRAWLKSVLHACKHARAGVLGVWIGDRESNVVDDAVPLFHDAPTSIAVEVALRAVDAWLGGGADERGRQILAVYHASLPFPAQQVAQTLDGAMVACLDDRVLAHGNPDCWNVRSQSEICPNDKGRTIAFSHRRLVFPSIGLCVWCLMRAG